MNLRFITQKENIRHSIKAGRFKCVGMDNGHSRMLESDVIKICELLEADELSYDEILIKNGLDGSRRNRDIITKIKSGHIWKHISKDYKFNIIKRKSMGTYTHLSNDVTKILNEGVKITEMYKIFNIPNDKNEKDKFAKRIKVKLSIVQRSTTIES